MRRMILFSLLALIAMSAANYASAQRHGGAGHGFGRGGYGRGGYGLTRARVVSPYGFGYASSLPYDSFPTYADAPQPILYVQQPPVVVQPPARAAAEPEHSVVTEYKWPAASAASSPAAHSTTSETDSEAFGIVLKNGSTLSAVSVFASDDGLHYVDTEERHLRISMIEVDRAATLKLNRARNLNLYLPAAQ